MLYFSELNKTRVLTTDKKPIGKLYDLIFSASATAQITKLVIAIVQQNKSRFFQKVDHVIVPVDVVQRINGNKIIIKDDFEATDIGENELYVRKNLLDTQVIDIEGSNIVRVNDVLLQKINGKAASIYGVDIGPSGILRWLKLEKPLNRYLHLFHKSIPQTTLAWSDIQPLELTQGRVMVKRRFDQLKKLHPSDLADYLETQNFKNVFTIIQGIDREYLAQVISELNPNFQINLLKRMPLDKISYIVSIMESDDAVDVISQFSKKKQEIILKKIPEEEASNIRRLFKFSTTLLGEFLNTHFIAVSPEQTVADVVKKIKEETSEFSLLDYIYVVNKEGHLIGVFNLHELMVEDYDTPVFRFMYQDVITVYLNTPFEIAFRRMIKYKITSIPVIDDKKKIIGIVSIDDIGSAVIERFKL